MALPSSELQQTSRPGANLGPTTGLRAAVRHELRLLLFSPVTYLFQAGFLVLLSVCLFLVSDYYNEDQASIAALLRYLPWLALLLVPALAMRGWSQHQDDRSAELVLTLPIALPALVLGRFLAGWLLLCITLAFTFVLPATAAYLGEPDVGAMLAGYLGAALMMAAYYAIALFGAALAREPLGALVVSITLIAALLLLGWDAAGRLLQDTVPAAVVALLPLFSPAQNLADLGRGLLDVGSLGALLLITFAGLAACCSVVAYRGRHGGWRDRWRLAALLAVTLGALVLLLPGAARLPWSLDLTDEQEFTLDRGTREILAALPRRIEVTLYWSAGQANVPMTIKAHARRLQDLLDVMARQAEGRLRFQLVDPRPDSEAELQASHAGMRRVPLSSGDVFYLGATVSDGQRVGRVPYFDLRRSSLLEYDLAVALDGLTRAHTPRVGILSPLVPPASAEQTPEGLSFVAELRRNYDVAIIPFFTEELPADLDVLLLIDATLLKKRALFAIDQYLLNGGSVIILIDPYLQASPRSNEVALAPSADIDDISDLLRAYGVGYDGKSVVGDAAAAARVRDREQTALAYPYWLRLRDDGLSSAHQVTAGLNELLLAAPGAFTLEDGGAVQPLIRSSDASNTIDRAALAQSTPRQLAMAFKADGASRILAAVRQGLFESAYGAPPDGAESDFLPASRAPGLLFAVADVDWVADAFALERRSIGDDVMVRPLNDNLALLLNLIGYASGKDALISVRSRGRVNRTFTRVERLFRQAEVGLREQEATMAQRVAELEESLRAVANTDGDGPDDAGATDRLQRAEQQQGELLAARRALRQIRGQLRQEVDELGQAVRLLNILSGPVLVVLFFGAVTMVRRRGQRRSASGPTASTAL